MGSKPTAAAATTVQAEATFRELAKTEKPFVLPGVHDGLSARLAERARRRANLRPGRGRLDASCRA